MRSILVITIMLLLLPLFGCGKSAEQNSAGEEKPVYSTDPSHASKLAYASAIIEAKDEKSQIRVQVSNDGQWVRAVSTDGAVLWEKNMIRRFGEPVSGKPVVHKISIKEFDTLEVVMGNNTMARFDLKSGDFIDFTEDKL
ncbi:MAG: hypothetical protein AB1489_03210 [Acidobacteriota bacterium]